MKKLTMYEEAYKRQSLAMIELMQAADFAKSNVIAQGHLQFAMKRILNLSVKASNKFLRLFSKHATDEAANELEGVGSILYELALAYTSIPESAIDDFSKDLALLVNKYNERNR